MIIRLGDDEKRGMAGLGGGIVAADQDRDFLLAQSFDKSAVAQRRIGKRVRPRRVVPVHACV